VDKVNRWGVAHTGGGLYVTIGERVIEGGVSRLV
jgi:hypothetical protein